MRKIKAARAAAYVRHLCSLGLDSALVIPSIVAASRELVGADWGAFFWAGNNRDIASLYSEHQGVYDTLPEYKRLTGTADIDSRFTRGQFFAEVVAPCGARHFIDVVVSQAGRGWGTMILARGSGPAFTESEQQRVGDFSNHIAHAIRQPAQAQTRYVDSNLSAIVLTDWDGRIIHRCATASQLLLMMSDDTTGAPHPPVVMPLLLPLIHRLQHKRAEAKAEPVVVASSNRWGHFVWRGYPLDNGAGCLLHGQHQESLLVQALRHSYDFGLSGQQQIVSARLVDGASYKTIAQDLRVKESTVTGHVREIYCKLDIRDMKQLAARLINSHPCTLSAPPTSPLLWGSRT